MMWARMPKPKETDAVDSKVSQSFRVVQTKRCDGLYCSHYLKKGVWSGRNRRKKGKKGKQQQYTRLPENPSPTLGGIVFCVLQTMDSLQEQLTGQKQWKQSFSGHILQGPSIKGHDEKAWLSKDAQVEGQDNLVQLYCSPKVLLGMGRAQKI